ncbi:DUF6497 family protein [Tabrizicola sp. BL-A-41-H6]|uniref:DUF6497 family protein n=1 Tax=Tabrizicola sp. BL-A-41-H6 TaxID=3421107 RepID=UPI003D665693
MRHLHRIFAASLAVLFAGAGGCEETPSADAVTVPSGREVRFLDVISNVPGAEGATARFRFVVPGLAEGDSEADAADMQALCDTYALPRIDAMQPPPQQIIISLAGKETPFGEAAPEVVQFFEAYSVQDGACVWEVF